MSDAFAIAAVTNALTELLTARLAPLRTDGLVDPGFSVMARAPDRISTTNQPAVCLNVFLYEVAVNPGWANLHLPSRDADGRAVANPPLALDLQYLVSAYGVADGEAELILGHAMQVLHENPGVSRAAIRRLLDPNAAGLTPEQKKLRERLVPLADAIETIKLSPRWLKPEEMSRIWSSLQAHYRPSVVYQATVVLIESRRPVRAALPVLRRGPGDRGVETQAGVLPPFPTLLAAFPPDRNPAVRTHETLRLFGFNLTGSKVEVRFEHQKLDRSFSLAWQGEANPKLKVRRPDPEGADQLDAALLPELADTCLEFKLADLATAAQWAAGWYRVQVLVSRDGQPAPRASNVISVAVAPRVALPASPLKVLAGNQVVVTINPAPAVRAGQEATALIGQEALAPRQLTADEATPKFSGTLPAAMLVSGTKHVVRLRVDGVESLYFVRVDGVPQVDATQQLQVP